MYKIIEQHISLPARILYEELALIKYNTYKSWCQRGKLKRTQPGKGEGNEAYIALESIPLKERKIVIEAYPPPEIKEMTVLEKYYQVDLVARNFFAEYEIEPKRHLLPLKQREYVANAELFQAMQRLINDHRATRAKLNKSNSTQEEIFKSISNDLKALDDEKHPHSIPKNWRTIRNNYIEFINSMDYSALVHGNMLNRAAIKVQDTEQEAALRQLLRVHTNLNNEHIAGIYNDVADKLGWAQLTAGSVRNYRIKWNLTTYIGQKGLREFNNNKTMQFKRSAPVYPLSFWTVDGWDAELLYQKTSINKDGHDITTYHNRMTLVVVLDPCLKYPIGFAIGTHETPELIKVALRNAIKHTEELFGSKHKVLQMQSDRYAVKKMTPFYDAISNVYTPAQAGNAKAKIIEPYFKQLNQKYCQLMPNWAGFGVKSKTQPNSEFLNKIKHSIPDEFGVRLQLERIIEAERQSKAEEYIKLYHEMPANNKYIMSHEDYLLTLGETTGFTNKLIGSGLTISIDNEKRTYDSFDVEMRRYSHLDWTIYFDPDDKEKVLAHNETQYFMMEEKHLQPMAFIDQKIEDYEELSRVRDFNKELKQMITKEVIHDAEIVKELFAENKELDHTLAKLVLTNSIGEHKNQRYLETQTAVQKLTKQDDKKTERKAHQENVTRETEYLNKKVSLNKYL